MESINYANGSNMTLPADAQIVQGISGNAVYLPAGAGTMPIAGNRNELTISLWRQWDGIVEADDYRGVFSTANIKAYFDQATDFLTIELAGVKTVTDIKDAQGQTHWCFLFSKNSFFKIYKNAELKAELTAGNYPVDFSEGFTLGGGRTHATFDEVRKYKTVVTEPEIMGLYRLVTKGTQVQQLENIVTEATPKYLGVVETVPDTKTAIIMKGEKLGAVDANPGDWVLSGRTIGGWKVGVCYKWSGAQWLNLEPEVNYAKEYQACLVHLFEIEELKQQTGHFGALFAKVLVAQKALIDNLITKNLLIDSDTNNPNDFETRINKNDGVLVRNHNKTILNIEPTAGNAVFNGDLKANKIFLNKANQDEGVIEAVNNDWKFVIQPSHEGVELCIMGGDGGLMLKKQLYTYISGGLMSLAVMGNISCSKMFSSQITFDSWQKIDIPVTQYYDGTTNIFAHQNNIILITNTKEIFISSNEGILWEKKKDLLADSRNFDIIKATSNNEYILTVGTKNNKSVLFKSKDFGVTWDNTNIEADDVFCSAEDIFISKNHSLYKISSDFLNKEKIYDVDEVVIAVYSNKKIWITQTFNNLNYKHCLYFSLDKGKTWQKRLQGDDVYQVVFNNNSIFIGNSEGVKKSLDKGVTWTTISNEKACNLFYIDKYLVILPYENKGGIFVSDNNGASFSFQSVGYSYNLQSMGATPVSRIITTNIIGTTSGKTKAVLLVNKNKQFF